MFIFCFSFCVRQTEQWKMAITCETTTQQILTVVFPKSDEGSFHPNTISPGVAKQQIPAMTYCFFFTASYLWVALTILVVFLLFFFKCPLIFFLFLSAVQEFSIFFYLLTSLLY